MERRISVEEEQVYRMCSPDFHGLTYANAALLLHCSLGTVYRRLKQLKIKAPQLFYNGFIRPRTPRNKIEDFVYYEEWMDKHIKIKF